MYTKFILDIFVPMCLHVICYMFIQDTNESSGNSGQTRFLKHVRRGHSRPTVRSRTIIEHHQKSERK